MYQPREDSELMVKWVVKIIRKEKPQSFLDMGCGSGVQSRAALSAGISKSDIVAVDIDEEALGETAKLGVRVSKSNLFKKVEGKFDLIAFNAPYLPEDRYDKKKDTSGGKCGWETIARFLKQAKEHLTEKGKILLLFSSLTNKEKVGSIAKNEGYTWKEAARKRFFMEEIYVWVLGYKGGGI